MDKKKNVYLLGLTSFFNDASSEGVYSLLPLLLKDPAMVGVVGGIFNGLSYMIKPFSGYWADRAGKAKPFIIFGYALSALSRTLISVASKLLVPLLIVLDRIGKGIRDSPRDALLASVKDRGWAFGLHRALDTGGAVLGVILALVFSSRLDVRSSILLLGLLGFATLLPLIFVEDEERKTAKKSFVGAVKLSLQELGTFSLVVLFLGMSLISPAIFIDKAVEVVGKGGIAFYLAFNIVYMVSAYLLGKKSDRWGRRPLLYLGALLLVVSLLLISQSSILAVFLSFVTFGVAYGSLLPTIFAAASDRAGKEKATELGVVQFLLGLSILVSSSVAGMLVKLWGSGALALFAMPALVAVILLKLT